MLDAQALGQINQMIQQAIAPLLPPPGYTREKAWDPSTGVGLVKDGATDAFWFDAVVTAIAPAANQTTQINISADADFYCTHFLQWFNNHASLTAINAATIVQPLVTVLMSDTGSSRSLMSAPIPIPAIAGNGQLPYRLQKPRLFQRTTSINFAFNNFDTALTYDGHFILGGFKVYSNQ
jgi:hypothetical protein